MKKLIFISVLFFSFNVWAETIKVFCEYDDVVIDYRVLFSSKPKNEGWQSQTMSLTQYWEYDDKENVLLSIEWEADFQLQSSDSELITEAETTEEGFRVRMHRNNPIHHTKEVFPYGFFDHELNRYTGKASLHSIMQNVTTNYMVDKTYSRECEVFELKF